MENINLKCWERSVREPKAYDVVKQTRREEPPLHTIHSIPYLAVSHRPGNCYCWRKKVSINSCSLYDNGFERLVPF
jgi:hypothetical protein